MAIITPPPPSSSSSKSSSSTSLQAISISSFHHPKKPSSQSFNNTLSTSSSLSLLSINTPPAILPHATSSAQAIEVLAHADGDGDADAASVIFEFERLLGSEKSDDFDDEEEGKWDWRNGSSLMRRKMRRKRRIAEEMNKFGMINETEIKNNVCLKNGKLDGHFLTKKAEAEYSFCLKEEARVVALRKRIEEETGGRKLTSAEWAAAAGMSRHSLDMILCNGREAEERIIRCYTKLVVSIAFTYQGKGLSLEDLIQEGNIGLLHGAKRFNPEKGCKLSTYVYWWIRQAISRAIDKSKIIRLPGTINELVPRICEANAGFSRKMHRWPTCEELAEVVNKDVVTVGLALGRNREPISIDQMVPNRARLSLQEIIEGPKETTPEEMMKKHFMKKDLEKLLNEECDIREKNIIKLYYGLNGDVPLSFEEIGKKIKLSRERVRQISCNAMLKLKQASNIRDFESYV